MKLESYRRALRRELREVEAALADEFDWKDKELSAWARGWDMGRRYQIRCDMARLKKVPL